MFYVTTLIDGHLDTKVFANNEAMQAEVRYQLGITNPQFGQWFKDQTLPDAMNWGKVEAIGDRTATDWD